MNIYEALKLIRDSNGPEGEYTKVADAVMDLYLAKQITSKTVYRMFGEILHIIIMESSPYGKNTHHIAHPE
jgi:hypothetical protein